MGKALPRKTLGHLISLSHMDSLENNSSHEVPGPRKSRLNKYAFAAALLASTTSILLGYGECLFHCIEPFVA